MWQDLLHDIYQITTTPHAYCPLRMRVPDAHVTRCLLVIMLRAIVAAASVGFSRSNKTRK